MRVTFVIFLCFLVYKIEASKLQMPSYAMIGDEVKLECSILLDTVLFPSIEYIRWLKDGQEVYKFDPTTFSGIAQTNIEGVNINVKDSSYHKLVLSTVDLKSSGTWTCETKSSDGYYGVSQMSGTLTVLLPKAP